MTGPIMLSVLFVISIVAALISVGCATWSFHRDRSDGNAANLMASITMLVCVAAMFGIQSGPLAITIVFVIIAANAVFWTFKTRKKQTGE